MVRIILIIIDNKLWVCERKRCEIPLFMCVQIKGRMKKRKKNVPTTHLSMLKAWCTQFNTISAIYNIANSANDINSYIEYCHLDGIKYIVVNVVFWHSRFDLNFIIIHKCNIGFGLLKYFVLFTFSFLLDSLEERGRFFHSLYI